MKNRSSKKPWKASILTPPGKGGIAVIGIYGAHWDQVLAPYFHQKGRRKGILQYGHIKHGDQMVDEVLLFYQKNFGEIHCHGGMMMVQKILELLDLPVIPWQEYLSFWRKERQMDAIQEDAYQLLPLCRGKKSLSMMLYQLEGSLSRRIYEIIKLLQNQEIQKAQKWLQFLLQGYQMAKKLLNPPKVLILGAPNTGKSSLINILTEKETSLVTSIPGTTRDLVKREALILDYPFDFTDSAGLRSTEDFVESLGIEKAKQEIAQAQLLITLFDIQTEPDSITWEIYEREKERALLVLNKSDLGAAEFWQTYSEAMIISCKEKTGIQELKEALVKKAFPLPVEDAYPFTSRQKEILEKALQRLKEERLSESITFLQDLLENPSSCYS